MAALVLAASLATAALAETTPAAAPPAETAATPEASDVTRIASRTATYQVMSSLNDFLYGVVFAGGVAAGGLLAVTSLVTEPVVHFLHETAWGNAPPPADQDEALRRVPVKSATYTLANSGRVFTTAWLLTGNPIVAVGMVAFNAVGDATVYAINDAAWAHFGGTPPPAMGSAGAP